MKINEKLYLVVPVDTENGTVFVHSAPLSVEAFESNFLLIAKTFRSIYAEGLGYMAGPRVAKLQMRKVASGMNGQDEKGEDLADGPGTNAFNSLMAEIRRLSNVVAPGPNGWETVPLQEAVTKGQLTQQDSSEVENAIVFFIVASAMHKQSQVRDILDGAVKLWDAQITSSNCTVYVASLRTSTEVATSEPPAPAFSGPQ